MLRAVGKQPQNISTNITESLYVDAGVGSLMSRLGVRVGESMPLYERLQIQMEIAKHIELLTRGVEGFVIDRTPADVMAYTLDLVGHTNEDRCIELALDIEKFCHKTAISNFNAIAGLRPGVALRARLLAITTSIIRPSVCRSY